MKLKNKENANLRFMLSYILCTGTFNMVCLVETTMLIFALSDRDEASSEYDRLKDSGLLN